MLQPRFYISSKPSLGALTVDNPYIVNHIRALRLKKGDKCAFFCPHISANSTEANEWHATLEYSDKKYTLFNIYSENTIHRCLNYEVNLFLGMIHHTKIEWVIEKATELGINAIYLLSTKNSYHDLSKTHQDKQIKYIERLNKIAISACEQSGCNDLPHIEIVAQWKLALNKVNIQHMENMNLFLSTDHAKNLIECNLPKSITIPYKVVQDINIIDINTNTIINCFVGPEGGWSTQEEQDLMHIGFTPLNLGKRILRTETACIAIMSYLSMQL